MILNKLAFKAQTWIVRTVRTALGLRFADKIDRAVGNGLAVPTRFQAVRGADDPFAAFSEWGGPEDAEACGDL